MSTKRLLASLLALLMLFSLLPAAALAEEPEAVVPPAQPVTLNYGYYLIGRYGWTTNDLVESRDMFQTNYSASTEEYKLTTVLEEGQQIKVVLVWNIDQIKTWYPEGDFNYTVDAAHAGTKIIYFRPNYNADWAEFGGYMWIDDLPTYHVYFNQPEHGTLTAEPTDPHEGDTVTITAVPDPGYYPSGAIKSNDWPPNFSNYDSYHATFTMPGNDVTVFMQGNSMSVDAGYYCGVDKGVSSLTPDDKFQAESSEWGEYTFETVVEEGQSLAVMCITTNGSWSWTSPLVNYTVPAEQAGPIKVFLTETDPGEGYTKVIEISHWAGSGPVIDKEAWMIVKSALPITVDPNIANGTVTAPAGAFEGETVTLTATPDPGYELDTISVTDANGDPVGLDGMSFIMPATAVTVTATFKTAMAYTITVQPCEGATITLNKQSAMEGETITMRYSLAADYTLDSITAVDGNGDPVTLVPRTDGPGYKFTMPASDVTITPVTSYHPKYQLWVGGIQVTGDNCSNILGDGSASYEPATRTLSFSSAEPAITGEYGGNLITYMGEDSLTIEAPNGLHLDASQLPSATAAIYSYYATFLINGDLTLDVSNGVKTYNGSVTINGNVTGNAVSILIQGNAGVIVNGTVTTTNPANARAIYSDGPVRISGDLVSAGFGNTCVYAGGDITIDGDVTIAFSTTQGLCALQSTGGSVSVGGSFTSRAKASQYVVNAAQGFTCAGDVTVFNNFGKGIYSANGAITVVSGTWNVTASSEPLKAAGGIVIPATHAITTPEGGVLAETGGFTVVTEADGTTPAVQVIIEPAQTPAAITVTFNAGEGTVDPATVEVNAGGSLETLPEPVLENWKFLGWFTEPAENAFVAGQGTQVTTETTFNEDTTVYAHWRLPGDINGDGSVNNKDVTRLTRWLKTHDVEVVSFNLDVNGDGSVNNKDLTRLVRWVKSHDVVLN